MLPRSRQSSRFCERNIMLLSEEKTLAKRGAMASLEFSSGVFTVRENSTSSRTMRERKSPSNLHCVELFFTPTVEIDRAFRGYSKLESQASLWRVLNPRSEIFRDGSISVWGDAFALNGKLHEIGMRASFGTNASLRTTLSFHGPLS